MATIVRLLPPMLMLWRTTASCAPSFMNGRSMPTTIRPSAPNGAARPAGAAGGWPNHRGRRPRLGSRFRLLGHRLKRGHQQEGGEPERAFNAGHENLLV